MKTLYPIQDTTTVGIAHAVCPCNNALRDNVVIELVLL